MDDLSTFTERSDVVTIHTPLLPETTGLIGAEELRRLGSDDLLINVARGGIVDQQALVEALEAGTIGGAVIDVYDPKPADEHEQPRGGVPVTVNRESAEQLGKGPPEMVIW